MFFCIIFYAKSDEVEFDEYFDNILILLNEFFNQEPLQIAEKICQSVILNETNVCVDQLKHFCIGITKREMWALRSK